MNKNQNKHFSMEKESDIKAWENMDKKSDIKAWENFHSACVGKI